MLEGVKNGLTWINKAYNQYNIMLEGVKNGLTWINKAPFTYQPKLQILRRLR